MAQEMLNNLLNFTTSPNEILEWLISDESNETKWVNFNKNCPRDEFVTFFLNYLREQFISVLQNSNGPKQTPAKKVLPQPQTLNTSESTKTDIERIETKSSLVQSPIDDKNDLKKQLKNNTSQQNFVLTNQSDFVTKSNLENSICKNIKPEFAKCHTPKNNKSNEDQISNCIQAASPTSPQTSTPITKKKNTSFKKRVELVSCNSSQNQNFNPAFKNSIEYENFTNRKEGRNISFDGNSFPSLGGRNSNSLNVSNYSQNFSKDDSFDLTHSNISIRSNISVNNKILQSPVSPLYSNSAAMLSPINSKVYQNKFHNNQSNNSFNHVTSTPERTPNNTSKGPKASPRQSLSLSDFITTDTRSSKKNSTKKNQSKSWSKSGEQNDDDQYNGIFETSAVQSENKNKRRRKVNPTRLNITDEKGDKENTVFGEVSRPFTQNPQFVNVPPIDKSVDNESFQIERGLVKMERQKRPEIIPSLNVIDEKYQPKWKILQRTPNKLNKPSSVIIPDRTLVENIQVLDLLAELYSGFLDNNLVFNPMTELYFIINLITNQYKDNVKQLPSITPNVGEILQCYNDESMKDCKYEKKELSALKKSLNFDNLVERNDSANDMKISKDNNSHVDNKTANELGCSNLVDDTKENLNLINKKLKQISVSTDQIVSDDQSDIFRQEVVEELNVTKNCVKLYLNTPHNCVYFSTKVLNFQKDFLKCLDRVTLKLLCENNQISLFQPELCKYMDLIYNMKVIESNKTKSSLNIGMVELNVCFQIDTDNRENFPSSIAFQCFRKQRDMFYEILKIWEDHHLVPGWTFQIALSGKIKSMLMVHSDITNFTHFTRLFKSQMLISCIQSGQQEDLLDDETLNFLKNLKDINPEKLTHLQKKLVTPLSQNGPVPLPSFPGVQEFYKDFILYASHPMFYKYLENTFIHEIMELNNSQFAGSDIEETETEVDERTKQNFVICLSSLRLLAKFLGFLTSLPYRSETSMLEDVISTQIALRSECLPHIDLQYCLRTAVIQGKLSLTVPWIVEYLAMMDHASLRLPYYKKVLKILYCIYRASNYHTVTNSDDFMSQQTAVLVKLSIGWLFELPIFPTELYYSWQAKYNNKTLKLICDKQKSIVDAEDSVISVKHSLFLDKLEMIDNRILYSCCPFLRELNILLTPGNSNLNNSTSHRHVTPVTSQLQKPMRKVNVKHLEIQLEEAFFHGQPMSTRKTVEYVSERIASSCVKYICNSLLPVERQNNSVALKRLIEENYGDTCNQNTEILKNTLLKDMNTLAINTSENIKKESDKIIPNMCESRVNQSIKSLLADDCLEPVKQMCIKIATRMAMERIDQWIQSHIIGGSTFMKDMELELNKITKDSEDVVVKKKYHNINAASPTNIIDGSREIIWNLLETRGQCVTVEILNKFFDQLYLCLTERCDLKVTSEKIIASLTVDLCLFLISYRYDIFTKEVQDKVFRVLKIDSLKFSESESPLSRILSPRNIMLMSQSLNDAVWINFGKFLNNLLKENILTIDSVSEQAVALFRRDLPVAISKNLSTCLKQAVDDYKSSDEETERIKYLLGWIAGACNDIDSDGFNFSFD